MKKINRFDGYEGRYTAETSETNAKGEIWENVFYETFTKRGHRVIDCTKSLEYQIVDTDFVVYNKNNDNKFTVEVKSCEVIHKTNNMFCERAERGWVKTCKADYIAYIDTVNELMYLYRLNDLRHYIKEHERSLRTTYYPESAWLVNAHDFISWCNDLDKITYTIDIKNDDWKKNIKG